MGFLFTFFMYFYLQGAYGPTQWYFFCLTSVYLYFIMYIGWSETVLFTISFLQHAIYSLLLCFSVYNVHMVQLNSILLVLHVYIDTKSCIQGGQKQFYLYYHFFCMLFVHIYHVFPSAMCIWSN